MRRPMPPAKYAISAEIIYIVIYILCRKNIENAHIYK